MTERREDIADESKSRERFARFRKWFATTKWFDDPVYGEISDATWLAAERDTRERCAHIAQNYSRVGVTGKMCENVAEAIRKGGE